MSVEGTVIHYEGSEWTVGEEVLGKVHIIRRKDGARNLSRALSIDEVVRRAAQESE